MDDIVIEHEGLPKKDALYKAQFDSGMILQYHLFPQYISQLMMANMMLENKEMGGVAIMLSSLSSMIPPLQQIFINYKELKQDLQYCRELNNEWTHKYKKRVFPTELSIRLQQLYEDWWDAFNRSGAGLNIKVWRDPIKERWRSITGSG